MTALEKLAERLSRLITRTLINIAVEEAVREAVEEAVKIIAKSSPKEIWELASSGKSLIELIDEKWARRIERALKVMKVKGARQSIIELIDKLELSDILGYLYMKMKSEKYGEGIENLYFIASSPMCMKWLKRNFDEIKEYIKTKLSE